MAVAAVIVSYQLFVPPIVGIADQSDFRRIIGRFGYKAEQPGLEFAFVAPKYIRSDSNRVKNWEQFSSEYLFVAAALGLNKVISKDGKLDIQVIGLIHALAFIAALARLLWAARSAGPILAIAIAFVLTDVAYVSYLNTFYAEPVSMIFFLLLAGESVEMIERGWTGPSVLRWSLWAVLFVLAKPVNAIPGLLIGLFANRFGRTGRIGSAAILASAVFALDTTPQELRNSTAYNVLFLSVLPESRNPAADLQALGLDWRLQDASRTGAWSPDTRYPELEARGDIGVKVTHLTLARFYLARPSRLWRHIQAKLPIALSQRVPWYGNFEPSAGFPPSTLSRAFALWSDFHEHVLQRAAKFLFFALLAPAAWVLARWRQRTLWMEFFALLGLCALAAFLTAIFGDAWDDVKHLFLFNLLIDAMLVSLLAWAFSKNRASNIKV